MLVLFVYGNLKMYVFFVVSWRDIFEYFGIVCMCIKRINCVGTVLNSGRR